VTSQAPAPPGSSQAPDASRDKEKASRWPRERLNRITDFRDAPVPRSSQLSPPAYAVAFTFLVSLEPHLDRFRGCWTLSRSHWTPGAGERYVLKPRRHQPSAVCPRCPLESTWRYRRAIPSFMELTAVKGIITESASIRLKRRHLRPLIFFIVSSRTASRHDKRKRISCPSRRRVS
jgi:hypothetical protein